MEGEAVHLYYEPRFAPEEVDLVAEETDIALGAREAGGADKRKEALLGLGPRERRTFVDERPERSHAASRSSLDRGLNFDSLHQSPSKGFPERAFELGGRNGFLQIDEGPSWSRHK
jgi:hypothetical protein